MKKYKTPLLYYLITLILFNLLFLFQGFNIYLLIISLFIIFLQLKLGYITIVHKNYLLVESLYSNLFGLKIVRKIEFKEIEQLVSNLNMAFGSHILIKSRNYAVVYYLVFNKNLSSLYADVKTKSPKSALIRD